jgi:hypothetical protein
LHAALVLRCCDDDAMGVDLTGSERDHRRGYVVQAMKWSENAASVSARTSCIEINLLGQREKVSCSQSGDASCDSAVQPHKDDDVVHVGSYFRADLDFRYKTCQAREILHSSAYFSAP